MAKRNRERRRLEKPASHVAQPRPKPLKPAPLWARPGVPPAGDTDPDLLYRAVGKALTSWELLELEYAGVFDVLMGRKPDSHAPHRAYGAVLVSSTKREMITAAAEAYFHVFPDAGLQAIVKAVMATHELLSQARNDIAHGIVQPYAARFKDQDWNGTWCLFPAQTATRAIQMKEGEDFTFRPKFAYTAADILKAEAVFRAVRPPVAGLILSLRQHETSPKEPAEE